MAKSRDPFFMALDRIRQRARGGGYVSGRPIVIVDEARYLGVSTTPVREALSWLCGEGLVERGPSGGFLATRLDAAAVRDRYGLRLICLLAGLDLTSGLPTQGRTPRRGEDAVADLRALFDELVGRAGNAALLDAYDRVEGQLLEFTPPERRLFEDVDREAEDVLAVAGRDDNGELRTVLRRYHQRRIEASAILALDLARDHELPGLEAGDP